MLYLLLVSHVFQWNEELPNSNGFKNSLKEKVKSLKIDLIAEEFSKEALIKNGIEKTIGQKVAKELKINHKFCDPEIKERKRIGYPLYTEIRDKLGFSEPVLAGSLEEQDINQERKKYYYIREEYWLKQLDNYKNKNIIFICGSDHIDNSDSFKKLLLKFGFKFKIFNERFKIN